MKLITINEAEAIIEPFWDGGSSPVITVHIMEDDCYYNLLNVPLFPISPSKHSAIPGKSLSRYVLPSC